MSILKSSLLTPTVTLVDQALFCMLYSIVIIIIFLFTYTRYAAFSLNKYMLCILKSIYPEEKERWNWNCCTICVRICTWCGSHHSYTFIVFMEQKFINNKEKCIKITVYIIKTFFVLISCWDIRLIFMYFSIMLSIRR